MAKCIILKSFKHIRRQTVDRPVSLIPADNTNRMCGEIK